MKSSYLIFSFAFFLIVGKPIQAWTWTEVGNGGDMLVCVSNRPAMYSMYDVFEAEFRYGLKPNLPAHDFPNRDYDLPLKNGRFFFSDAKALASITIQRIEKKDPELYIRLLDWIKSFESETQFLDNIVLTDIPDTGIGTLPKHCELKQLIIQHRPSFKEQKRYLIAHDLWRLLDVENQAAAIIHEVLYRFAKELHPTLFTSERVRYLNAIILSDTISAMTSKEYQELKSWTFQKAD